MNFTIYAISAKIMSIEPGWSGPSFGCVARPADSRLTDAQVYHISVVYDVVV